MSDNDEIGVAVVGCLAMLVLVPLFTVIGACIGGAILWVAWNFAVVAAFHVTALTFFQCALIAAALSFIGGCFKATINAASK